MNSPWRRTPLITALAATGITWALCVITAGDPVLGSGLAQRVFLFFAVAASVVLFVLVAGTAILEIGNRVSDARVTELHRAMVYALLTFGVSFVGLRYLGFNLDTVLTTSALLTAVVGFAMQATLSSLIAGLALQADRVLHVGDSVILDGEPVEIVSLKWRAAVGRRATGLMVVIPNGKIADAVSEILRKGESHRAEFVFRAPLHHSPQEIGDLAREAVADLPPVDRERPIAVAPVELDPGAGGMRMRVQYWTRRYADRSVVEGEAVRRIWYAMQRHRLNFSRLDDLDDRLRAREDVPRIIAARLGADEGSDPVKALAAASRLLYYAPDERIVLPFWVDGWNLVILRGEARRAGPFDLAPEVDEAPSSLKVEQLGPSAAIAHLADELSHVIGPYAKHAVARAGADSQDYAQICRRVAEEIDDLEARRGFLHAVLPLEMPKVAKGTALKIRRDAMGFLAADPALRANGELVVLAIPSEAQVRSDASTAA